MIIHKFDLGQYVCVQYNDNIGYVIERKMITYSNVRYKVRVVSVTPNVDIWYSEQMLLPWDNEPSLD